MARILLLTQVLPFPLNSGAKIRQYHMLRHLARRHEVTLVSFTRADDPPPAVEHLRGICQAVHPVPMRRSPGRNLRAAVKGTFTGLPIVIARDEVAEMEATLRALAAGQPFDVIHADQLSMAWWGRLAAGAAQPRPPRTLLDEHNAIYLLTRRMAATEPNFLRRAITAREARAFARYEAAMCRAFDAVLTVTAEDRESLLALFPPGERERLAPKFTVGKLTELLGGFARVARVIPNAPSVVNFGFNPVAFAPVLGANHKREISELLAPLGECPEVAEEKLEAYAVLTAMTIPACRGREASRSCSDSSQESDRTEFSSAA